MQARPKNSRKSIQVLIYINNPLHLSDCSSKIYVGVTLGLTWTKKILRSFWRRPLLMGSKISHHETKWQTKIITIKFPNMLIVG